jgi:hypothetical protein
MAGRHERQAVRVKKCFLSDQVNNRREVNMKKSTQKFRRHPHTDVLVYPGALAAYGSLTGKFPVILNDGKTVVYISDKSKEEETRTKYEQRSRELNRYRR